MKEVCAQLDDNDIRVSLFIDADKNNYIKYVKFINALKDKGYKLRKCDRMLLKSGEKGFIQKKLLNIAIN